MILFDYTDNEGILLGRESRYEPWGSSFPGPGFPVGLSFPEIPGIQLRVQSLAQDGVPLSEWSLFRFLLQHEQQNNRCMLSKAAPDNITGRV